MAGHTKAFEYPVFLKEGKAIFGLESLDHLGDNVHT